MVAEDSAGNTVDRPFFELTPESVASAPYPIDFTKEMKKRWAIVNKAIEHTGGTPVMAFNDQEDLLKKAAAAMGTNKVRIFVNYGSTRSPKDRLQIRSWQPFVESMDVASADSKLVAGNIDQMTVETATPVVSEDDKDGFF